MNKQQGASLIVALIMLTIITLVAVYSIEGSTIQSKMVANSLFNSLTYQECRNEQEANVRLLNINNNHQSLIDIAGKFDANGDEITLAYGPGEALPTITSQYGSYKAKSELRSEWVYIKQDPASRPGYELGSSYIGTVFENTCVSVFRFSTNSQTLAVAIDSLKMSGKQN